MFLKILVNLHLFKNKPKCFKILSLLKEGFQISQYEYYSYENVLQ